MQPSDTSTGSPQGWQGMESAPRDGTRVLLASADGWVEVGRWVTVAPEQRWGDAHAVPASRSGWSGDGREFGLGDAHPICWMPLPSLPVSLAPRP